MLSLAAYSYITNNYSTYMDTEENIKKVLTNTVTISHGIERNIEKVKFDYEVSEVVLDKDNKIGYVEMVFLPLDPILEASIVREAEKKWNLIMLDYMVRELMGYPYTTKKPMN